MSTSVPVSVGNLRPILPSHGTARVKSVLSGDTVILLGKATTPDGRPPEVVFTFEKVSSPR
jgi:staphylococcal nuclease domain-containing protein 1